MHFVSETDPPLSIDPHITPPPFWLEMEVKVAESMERDVWHDEMKRKPALQPVQDCSLTLTPERETEVVGVMERIEEKF